jgi:hypothetical protein
MVNRFTSPSGSFKDNAQFFLEVPLTHEFFKVFGPKTCLFGLFN